MFDTADDFVKGLIRQVTIREEGTREGFQNSLHIIPTEKKIKIINCLLDAGVKRICVASFVNPKVTPQMADAEEVLTGIEQRPEVEYSGVLLNRRGLERAVKVKESGYKFDLIKFPVPVSDSVLNRNGIKMTADEYVSREIASLVKDAKGAGIRCNAGISAAFGCSFQGKIPEQRVLDFIDRLLDVGIDSVGLNDTTGEASPFHVVSLMTKFAKRFGKIPLSLHFHNSRGAGLANILAALQVGIEPLNLDCTFGETGGDPPIPNSKGNVATEDVVCMLEGMGISTGIDLNKLLACSRMAQEEFEPYKFIGHVLKVGPSVNVGAK